MQNMVIFRDNQELDSADLNNLQTYARASFDSLVSDAITGSTSYYAGFSVAKTAATQVTVQPGDLYVAGASYNLSTASVIDFFSQLPLVTEKWCAIVANGSDIQTNIQPRDFLINATTGQTQPQSVAMQDQRLAVLNTVAGVEAPQPSYPSTQVGVVVIAYVLLNTTGVQQIVQYAPTQLPNLSEVEGQVSAINAWQTQISGEVDTLDTALANLSTDIKGRAEEADLQTLTAKVDQISTALQTLSASVTTLANKVAQSATPILVIRDSLLDTTYTNEGAAGFSAVVGEGIFFPGASSGVSTLALLNALDASAMVTNNYLLPAWTYNQRLAVEDYTFQLGFSTYAYQAARAVRLLGWRRRRHRCGARWGYSPSAPYWKSGPKDPVAAMLAFNSEVFTSRTVAEALALQNPGAPNALFGAWKASRQNSFWSDEYSEAYWDRVTTSQSASGQQIGQVFLNSQDGWLTQVGLYFSQAAATGDVAITICPVDANGAPDLNNALQHLTLPVASILVGAQSSGAGLPTLVETQVKIPPTFLSAGRRYSIVLTTGGAHYLACHNNIAALQGHLFYADSTGTFQLGTGAVKLNLYYAAWQNARYEISLQPISLSGGIQGLDFLHHIQEPTATALLFEVQIGGTWYALSSYGTGPNFSSAPALLPLRAVFIGTSDLMPAFGLGPLSHITATGAPATTFSYYTTSQTLSAASNYFVFTSKFVNWDSARHACVPTLWSGSSSFPATTVHYTMNADGSMEQTVTFALASPIPSYVLELVGSTTVAGDVFSVAEIIHSAS